MICGNKNTGDYYQWTLGTAYDVTTATLEAQININTLTSYAATVITGFTLNNDGTQMIVLDHTNSTIHELTFPGSIGFFNGDPSNICFPAGTLVSLDQGDIEIQKVDTNKHTLNGKKILFVTQTIPTKPDVVRIEKGAFAPNVPSQTVETTRAHLIEYNGERKMAEEWVNDKTITFVPNTHKILYNLLLETHEMMTVYNLQAETLNPVRKLAQKYLN